MHVKGGDITNLFIYKTVLLDKTISQIPNFTPKWECTGRPSSHEIYARWYSVFPAIGKQEGGCYKLTLTLLRAQRISMSPQDWAQITFRSEMHLNDFKNESGSQQEKGKIKIWWFEHNMEGVPKMISSPCIEFWQP